MGYNSKHDITGEDWSYLVEMASMGNLVFIYAELNGVNFNSFSLFLWLLQEEETAQPARLFQCSNASGVFTVDEIPDFTQVLQSYSNLNNVVEIWLKNRCQPEAFF